ncbi:MAG: family 78 glycoside hydrolase catalytic domain, partial [Clostridiales bacterium]|nr:family 78 glycoside hydrolase catalytic domain [Clostridiales bacterium]
STQPEGARIHLEFGEILQNSNFYNDNYRTAKGGFTYVSNGKPELVKPSFTFFGFRYVKVSGWQGEINPDDFTGCVTYSDLERTGFLTTGNAKINQLYSNSLWSLKSNFLDIPTDCPQRDERLGWTGDAQVFSATASYHMDTRAFYQKYLWDIQNEQSKLKGGVPAYAPKPPHGPISVVAAIWGDAATIIPDVLLKMFNEETYKKNFPMMKAWVDYVGEEIEKVHQTKAALWDFGFQFGDWLALDGPDLQAYKGDTPDDYLATVYYWHSLELVAGFAKRLRLESTQIYYSELAEKVKEVLLSNFFTPVGHLSVPNQAAYIAALNFGLWRDKDVLLQDFINLLQKHGNQIKCGFVGAPLICQTLAKFGKIHEAYKLILREDFPSWLYAVNLGATTIWERWNSVLPDGLISGTDMNSLNHYSYGSVVEFLYAYASGLMPSSDQGFAKALIAPHPHRELKSCNCKYVSNAGAYVVDWSIQDDGSLKVHIEIPFGCLATVNLPASSLEPFELKSGSYDYHYVPNVDFRQKFTKASTLDEIFEDEAASRLALSLLPQLSFMKGNGGVTIDGLRRMTMFGITNESVDALLDGLKEIG